MTTSGWRIPLSDLHVDEQLLAAAASAVGSGWWSMGPRVAELEEAFGAFAGARHALAVANGTAALHLALLACECGPGDEVVLPSLNFVSAANVVLHVGARPVFCDIGGPDDLNLDPDDLEAAISPATKAIVALHYGGLPCDMDEVSRIADERGLVVIEDAAHAPGAAWRGRACGTIGQVGCFSFFSNKNLPVGEGGMVVTGDDALAERLRLLRSHGMTSLTWDRHRGHAHTYDVVVEGFNYRLDELRAALGLVQLRRLPGENASRRRIVARYRARLQGNEGLAVPLEETADAVSAHHLAVALLPAHLDRQRFRDALATEGVQTSIHYPPIHRFSRYRQLGAARPLPRTEDVAARIVTLPLFGHMTDDQLEDVIAGVERAASERASAA